MHTHVVHYYWLNVAASMFIYLFIEHNFIRTHFYDNSHLQMNIFMICFIQKIGDSNISAYYYLCFHHYNNIWIKNYIAHCFYPLLDWNERWINKSSFNDFAFYLSVADIESKTSCRCAFSESGLEQECLN